jgi:hypothetical protein
MFGVKTWLMAGRSLVLASAWGAAQRQYRECAILIQLMIRKVGCTWYNIDDRLWKVEEPALDQLRKLENKTERAGF